MLPASANKAFELEHKRSAALEKTGQIFNMQYRRDENSHTTTDCLSTTDFINI